MTPADRDRFDRELERVLAELPAEVHELLNESPLIVEDHPSRKLCDDLGLEFRDDLCGLYQGISLLDRSVEPSSNAAETDLPESIMIFREGIVAISRNEEGAVSVRELRKQIRITILHEIGHHFGLDEDDLEALGYG